MMSNTLRMIQIELYSRETQGNNPVEYDNYRFTPLVRNTNCTLLTCSNNYLNHK